VRLEIVLMGLIVTGFTPPMWSPRLPPQLNPVGILRVDSAEMVLLVHFFTSKKQPKFVNFG